MDLRRTIQHFFPDLYDRLDTLSDPRSRRDYSMTEILLGGLFMFAEMYLKECLSASQISDKLGISKTAVLERLHTLGIRNVASIGERMTNPKNYRASVAPFGYRIVDGQLVANKKEVRISRLIVQLINEQKLSLMGAAKELMSREIRNRNGNVWWDHSMVRGIYQRWNGKV